MLVTKLTVVSQKGAKWWNLATWLSAASMLSPHKTSTSAVGKSSPSPASPDWKEAQKGFDRSLQENIEIQRALVVNMLLFPSELCIRKLWDLANLSSNIVDYLDPFGFLPPSGSSGLRLAALAPCGLASLASAPDKPPCSMDNAALSNADSGEVALFGDPLLFDGSRSLIFLTSCISSRFALHWLQPPLPWHRSKQLLVFSLPTRSQTNCSTQQEMLWKQSKDDQSTYSGKLFQSCTMCISLLRARHFIFVNLIGKTC